jgi:hypothetical protein
MPSPANLLLTVTSVADILAVKNQKSKIINAIRDTIDVLDALEALMLKVFAFASLMYLLFRIVH